MEYRIENGVLKEACDKSMMYAEVGTDVSAVEEDAFLGCGALCLAEVSAEEIRGCIAAGALILRDGVKRLPGGEYEPERPMSALREYSHEQPIKGGATILPIVAIPASVTEIGEGAIPAGATIIASAGSFAEEYAKQHGLKCTDDLKSALERQISRYERNVGVCRSRAAVYAKDKEKASAEYAALVAAEEQRLAEERGRLEGEIARLTEELSQEKERVSELSEQIRAAEKELSVTFFMNRRKKDELSAEIAELNEQLTQSQLRVNTIPVKIHATEVELNAPMANERIEKAKARCESLAAGVRHFEELSEKCEQMAEILRKKAAQLGA